MQYLKTSFYALMITSFLPLFSSVASAAEKKVFNAPYDMKISIQEVSPVTQETDLQIITLLKHNANGDKYIEAMNYFNEKLGGLLSSLRDQGEFIGDLGETLIFTPPAGSIAPKRVLLIGLGEESSLSVDKLKIAGRIAAREAVRLKAQNVSFAPTLRDQGSNAIDVGEGDAAIAEQVILAYDTEKRLQSHQLAPKFDIVEWTIETGPSYFNNVVEKVDRAIQSATAQTNARSNTPLMDKKISTEGKVPAKKVTTKKKVSAHKVSNRKVYSTRKTATNRRTSRNTAYPRFM